MENNPEEASVKDVNDYLPKGGNSSSDPLVMGHRGGFKPPLTLLGFHQSKMHKLGSVELDIWVTKDGQLAVFHGGSFGQVGFAEGVKGHLQLADEGKPLIWE